MLLLFLSTDHQFEELFYPNKFDLSIPISSNRVLNSFKIRVYPIIYIYIFIIKS